MKYFITHGAKRFEVIFPDECEPTLQDLSDAICKESGVPVHKQKLICKGKTLTSLSSKLHELRISPGSKVMLIGKKFDAEEELCITAVESVGQKTEESWARFETLQQEIISLEKSYLDARQTKESIGRLQHRVKCLSEELMKSIEQLDAIAMQADFLSARNRRKNLIVKINGYLNETDDKERKLLEMSINL